MNDVRESASRPRLLRLALASLTLTIGALALLLVLGEIVLRGIEPRYLDHARGVMVYSASYGWVMSPGFDAPLHGIPTTINERGYRGPVHPYARTPGRTRILMLGDSIVFGTHVRDWETFSALLETRNDQCEVINLGVESYGTDQELLLLEREGLRYSPDLVVLNVGIDNDPFDNYLPERAPFPKPYFTLEDGALKLHDEHVRLSPPRRLVRYLADESHVFNRLWELLPEAALPAQTDTARNDNSRRPNRRAANELTIRLVLRIRDLVRASGAPFLVVLHPDELTFFRRSRVSSRLSAAFRDAGVEILDLNATYKASRLAYDEIASDRQGHLTPLGHHLAAEALEPRIAALLETGPHPPRERAHRQSRHPRIP